MDPYATHVPVTAMALARTAKMFPGLPILECGCGDYSTPMAWLMADGRDRVIFSADPSWSRKYAEISEIVDIPLEAPKRWSETDFRTSRYKSWGLALMDSEESVVNRARHIPKLLEVAKVVVMHDARENVIPDAPYSAVFCGLRPWTWIGSNSVNVERWFP